MSLARPYEKCALVVGVLSCLEDEKAKVFEALEASFGPILHESAPEQFSYTDYYDEEMGSRPVRYFLMFRDLVDPSTLANIKKKTNEIELLFSSPLGNPLARRVNLDPGILSLSSLFWLLVRIVLTEFLCMMEFMQRQLLFTKTRTFNAYHGLMPITVVPMFVQSYALLGMNTANFLKRTLQWRFQWIWQGILRKTHNFLHKLWLTRNFGQFCE